MCKMWTNPCRHVKNAPGNGRSSFHNRHDMPAKFDIKIAYGYLLVFIIQGTEGTGLTYQYVPYVILQVDDCMSLSNWHDM